MSTKFEFDWQVFERNFVASKTLPGKADAYTETGRVKKTTLKIMLYVKNISIDTSGSDNSNVTFNFDVYSPTVGTGNGNVVLAVPSPNVSMATAFRAAIIVWALPNLGLTVVDNELVIEGVGSLTVPLSPTSYQTIVSQTGTAAPAVSGGFTPANTYSGTTFTWTRTGVGVYTLTASAAVFNTSKTGVFVAPLQNLNGSIRAVVTSTTVITVTTAVQSLAVLGLLGFTATNTDALLNGTMIYVQTYA